MTELSYDSFQAIGVEETANRYDARGEILHGPIPNASATIAATELVFNFPRQLPTAKDLELLTTSGFTDTGTGRNRSRQFTGPYKPYKPF